LHTVNADRDPILTPGPEGSSRAPSDAPPDRIARSRRRFMIPMLTIAVAAAIFGWSRWTAPQRADEVRVLVVGLLAEAEGPRPARGPIEGTDPVLAPIVRDALAAVRATGEARSQQIGVDVQAGDVPEGDGAASHHVALLVGGRPHTVLRVRHAGTAGIRIVGVINRENP